MRPTLTRIWSSIICWHTFTAMLLWLPLIANAVSVPSIDTQLSPTTSFDSPELLSSYCTSLIDQFVRTWTDIVIATTLVPGYEGYGPTNSLGELTGSVTSQSDWTSTYLYTQYPIRAYTAKPPCCQSCYFEVGTMELLYWSDQATATTPPPGAITTMVNSNGFIFTSPSVYMIFSSISAGDRCGQVGDIWTNTTIGFNAAEIYTVNPTQTITHNITLTTKGSTITSISSIYSQPPDGQLDFAELGGNCTASGYQYWPGNPFNAGLGAFYSDPCHPILQIPKRLLSLQPAWLSANCTASPGANGLYDPPSILTRMTAIAIPSIQTSAVVTRHASSQPALPAASASGPVTVTMADGNAATLAATSTVQAQNDVQNGNDAAPQTATQSSQVETDMLGTQIASPTSADISHTGLASVTTSKSASLMASSCLQNGFLIAMMFIVMCIL